MARIRTIKPEFFTSEDIIELEPLARLLYVALWCEADKEGRLTWKPKTFKIRYLPADDCDITDLCDALVTRGLVVIYGDGLAYIPSFKSHQHINPREKDSCLPAPDGKTTFSHPRVSDASVTRREEGRKEGREGKGKEDASPRSGSDEFEKFWNAYPKKKSKGDAMKAWKAIKPPAELVYRIMQSLESAKASKDWQKDGGQFIPYPATWLRAMGWEDESVQPQGKGKQSGQIGWSDIVAMGKKHGLEESAFDHPSMFRAAVFDAEGIEQPPSMTIGGVVYDR